MNEQDIQYRKALGLPLDVALPKSLGSAHGHARKGLDVDYLNDDGDDRIHAAVAGFVRAGRSA